MEYKLFDGYITLQALLKELDIIQSDGVTRGYLAEAAVLSNGQDEKRRSKKIRIGNTITIPKENVEIQIIELTSAEEQEYLEAIAEGERVTAIVKEFNQKNKKARKQNRGKARQTSGRKSARFPGT